jgi:hypothetical protein
MISDKSSHGLLFRAVVLCGGLWPQPAWYYIDLPALSDLYHFHSTGSWLIYHTG